MKKYIARFWNTADIPYGARVLTFATGVRWFGWGFGETLIPVLLYSFGHSFAQAGLLRAAYDITFILTLPIAGMIADRMRATTLILFGLFLYLFVGAEYFFAGVTGLAIFIVLARLFNGVSYALDSVGRETYFRRHVPSGKIATVFGYFDTVANLWWIGAAVLGIFLTRYFSVPALLLLITPTSLVSFLIVRRFAKTEEKPLVRERSAEDRSNNVFKEVSGWNLALKSLVGFNFFISFASAVVLFFLPIEVYREGADLSLVIIMGIVSAMPMLFGWNLGKWFDIKGPKLFSVGLLAFSLLLLSLSFPHGYAWKLSVSFLIGLVVELLSVGSNELVTVSSDPQHFGRVDGIMRSITNIGSMTGPLAIGILMDRHGIPSAYISLAILVFALAVIFHVLYGKGSVKKYRFGER